MLFVKTLKYVLYINSKITKNSFVMNQLKRSQTKQWYFNKLNQRKQLKRKQYYSKKCFFHSQQVKKCHIYTT